MKEADRMEVKEHASEFVRTLEEPILGQPKNSIFTNNMHNCFFICLYFCHKTNSMHLAHHLYLCYFAYILTQDIHLAHRHYRMEVQEIL